MKEFVFALLALPFLLLPSLLRAETVSAGAAERSWFATHGSIRIGTYDQDDFWVHRNEDGTFAGIMPDCLALLLKTLDVKTPVEWKFYDGRETALAALRRGEIDLVNPYYCGRADAERDGVVISRQVLSCSFSVLYRGDYGPETMALVATPFTRLGASYVRDNYPKARIVPCRNGRDCVKRLLAGEAHAVVMNSEGLRRIAAEVDESLSIRPLNAECPIAFAALPGGAALVAAFDRAIPSLTGAEVNALFDRHAAAERTQITARQFFARHPEYVWCAVAALLFAVLVVVVIRFRLERRLKIAETAAFANYFLDSFVSSYSVNLATHAFRPIRREERLERDYPVVPDYIASIAAYAEQEVHPDDRKEFLEFVRPENLKKILKERPVAAFAFRAADPRGERMFGLRVVRGADENSAAFAFADITDETRREQRRQRQLKEALDRAEFASRSKTAFLFNMSHDIRTPMNAIIGFTEIAKKSISDGAKVLDCLDKAHQAGNLLLALINNVLDMSRIEAGKAKVEERAGDVMLSFMNIESTMKALAESKGIALSFGFGEIRNRYVYADHERCTRVFVNLISNAVKYSKPGGWVKVRCEQVGEKAEMSSGGEVERCGRGAVPQPRHSTTPPSHYSTYRYTFEDNGIGMSEEFQKHVFEQFSRERNSTTSGIQGTGLGLALCKSFVELMCGTIECRSRQGEGTTFTVTLPFRLQQGAKDDGRARVQGAAATGETRSSAEVAAPTFAGRRILLVEDNELNREVAEFMLKEQGFEVDAAGDGAVAVGLVKDKGPEYYDYILMDIQMPVMNGYEATKAIRAWETGEVERCGSGTTPPSHIPIIALSANAFAEDRAASLAAGMDDHVAKPIRAKELLAALAKFRNVLRGG